MQYVHQAVGRSGNDLYVIILINCRKGSKKFNIYNHTKFGNVIFTGHYYHLNWVWSSSFHFTYSKRIKILKILIQLELFINVGCLVDPISINCCLIFIDNLFILILNFMYVRTYVRISISYNIYWNLSYIYCLSIHEKTRAWK